MQLLVNKVHLAKLEFAIKVVISRAVLAVPQFMNSQILGIRFLIMFA
jgi:hypothetical protein